MRYAAAGLVVGGALGSALPQIGGTLLVALAGVIVAAAGAGGPSRISRCVAVIVGCAVALVATYLLWPREDESDEPVPFTT